MQEDNIKELSKQERKKLEKQRKKAMKEAQKFHREEEKKEKKNEKKAEKKVDIKVEVSEAEVKEKASGKEKKSHSKIEQKLREKVKNQRDDLSKEERFIQESEKKIQNLQPKAHDDGFYVDEFGEREKQKRVAKAIREKENEKVKRLNKPLTSKQIDTRRIALSCVTLVVVVAIGITLSLTVLFKTEKIAVEGDNYYDKQQIISLSNVVPQQNIFIATLTSTPDRIKKELPYVEDAKVVFTVPDTVTIKITPSVPSYIVTHAGKNLLVSAKGRILEEVTHNTNNLPILLCKDVKTAEIGDYITFTDDNMTEILQQISHCIYENKFDKVSGIDVTDTARISIVYDNRISIFIGLPEDIDYKIRTAMIIINEKLDPNNLGVITGTLDVSACNTSKTSRFDPNATVVPLMTSPTGSTDPSATSATQGTTVDPRLPSNYFGFDTDGDGIDECFDTDGDGYADVYGTLDMLFGPLPTESTETTPTQPNQQTVQTPEVQNPTTAQGYTGFDLDGDGIDDCFDTDGDGYADVFGSLEPDEEENNDDNTEDDSSDSGQGVDPATGYTGFDLDGDGTYDCYDTDGDGYADLF